MNVYDNSRLLIKKKGRIQDPELFNKKVNEIFHNIESRDYDNFHADMWGSLGPVFNNISEQIESLYGLTSGNDLHLLDIGSGTGLSTEVLLRTKLSERICEITLLDSSSEMIEVSKRRSGQWGKTVHFINGYIEQLPVRKYDIILCCSVLHHIPDLKSFFLNISGIQTSGGIFIHLQDPNSEIFNSQPYKDRLERLTQHKRRIRKRRTLFGILYNLKRRLFREDFVSRVNAELFRQGVIRRRMSEKELWSVTDIHVEDLPYSANDGITLSGVGEFLPGYSLIFKTTYAFFGELISSLPEEFREMDAYLSQTDSMEGRLLAGIWQKRS